MDWLRKIFSADRSWSWLGWFAFVLCFSLFWFYVNAVRGAQMGERAYVRDLEGAMGQCIVALRTQEEARTDFEATIAAQEQIIDALNEQRVLHQTLIDGYRSTLKKQQIDLASQQQQLVEYDKKLEELSALLTEFQLAPE